MSSSTNVNTSYNVRPDRHSLAEINKLNPEDGVIVFDTDNQVNKMWNGVEWKSFPEGSTPIPIVSGYAVHNDTQYTSASPLSVLADTITLVPNNNGLVLDSQKPVDIATFYDGTAITGRNGDDITITFDALVTPTSVGTTYLEFWFDITGGTGTPVPFANLFKRLISFPKGNGVERPINFTIDGFTGATWEANGGVVKCSGNGTFELYDIQYIIKRTHKAV